MCKINESPCQLQLEARCFICFVLRGEWNGCFYSMDWLTVISQSFSYSSTKIKSWTFEECHSEDVCTHGSWSVGFACRDPCCSGCLHSPPYRRSDPGAVTASFYSHERFQNHLSIRPLCRPNSIHRSLSTSAASISSLILKFPSSSSFSAIIQNCQIS